MGIEGTYLNIIKAIYNKPTSLVTEVVKLLLAMREI